MIERVSMDLPGLWGKSRVILGPGASVSVLSAMLMLCFWSACGAPEEITNPPLSGTEDRAEQPAGENEGGQSVTPDQSVGEGTPSVDGASGQSSGGNPQNIPDIPQEGDDASWVHLGPDGKLVYKTDALGNRVMDFSSAGYMGGGVALPDVAVKETVKPSGGDDRAAIQDAINRVAGLPLVNGFRGAVLLSPGIFKVGGTIDITTSGVVVRGSGSGDNGTVISMNATGRCFRVLGSGSYSTSGSVDITGSFVPSGATSFSVSDASGFSVGDNVLITRTVTAAWISYVGMDKLVRDGQRQTWISAGRKVTTDRVIKAISGNTITLDAPLVDSYDSKYLGTPVGTMAKYTFSGRISQSGVERLKVLGQSVRSLYSVIEVNKAIDCWVRDVVGQNTKDSFVANDESKRITFDTCINNFDNGATGGSRPSDFDAKGTQILFNKCQANGMGSYAFCTHGPSTGPVVALFFSGTMNSGISPHMRWSTGVLADGVSLPMAPAKTSGIEFRNRATMGSGHGWTTGWSVAWNVKTPSFDVTNAPGTMNWVIGGSGAKASSSDPQGIFDHFNTIVRPKSLYLWQLYERLGMQAVINIGHSEQIFTEFD